LAATFVERGGQGSRVRYRISRRKEEAGPSTASFDSCFMRRNIRLISTTPTVGTCLSLGAEQRYYHVFLYNFLPERRWDKIASFQQFRSLCPWYDSMSSWLQWPDALCGPRPIAPATTALALGPSPLSSFGWLMLPYPCRTRYGNIPAVFFRNRYRYYTPSSQTHRTVTYDTRVSNLLANSGRQAASNDVSVELCPRRQAFECLQSHGTTE
jgi:hypothetical protein